MRYFFYNSFTLGSGYKYAELKDNVICETVIPTDIDCDFCNGGCQLVVRSTSLNTSVLVLKGILYVNDQKKFDEQGRKVYINFAIEASKEEQKKLSNVFLAMIAEWKNLCKYLGEAVKIPYPVGTYGYGIEQACIDSLINYLSEYNTDTIRKELGVDPNHLNMIVLKSSDYTYYESLAKDLYKSKKQSFKGNFVRQNIISGEAFTKTVSKASADNFEEFKQKLAGENIGTFTPEKNDCKEPEPKPDVIEVDEFSVTENPEPVIQTIDNKVNEEQKIELVITNNEKDDQTLLRKFYGFVKPHSKFLIGFACGLLVGYLILKKIL